MKLRSYKIYKNSAEGKVLSATLALAAGLSLSLAEERKATAEEINDIIQVNADENNNITVGDHVMYKAPDRTNLYDSGEMEDGVHCPVTIDPAYLPNANVPQVYCPSGPKPYAESVIPGIPYSRFLMIPGNGDYEIYNSYSGGTGLEQKIGDEFTEINGGGAHLYLAKHNNVFLSLQSSNFDQGQNSIDFTKFDLNSGGAAISENNDITFTIPDNIQISQNAKVKGSKFVDDYLVISLQDNAEGSLVIGEFNETTNTVTFVNKFEFPMPVETIGAVDVINNTGDLSTVEFGIYINNEYFTFTLSQPVNDSDGDGINDDIDNCINLQNPNQADQDNDGIGNVCDDDIDGDNVNNEEDAFPTDPNESEDTDADGVGDNADNCINDFNPEQTDSNNNGIGDACEIEEPDAGLDADTGQEEVGDDVDAGIDASGEEVIEDPDTPATDVDTDTATSDVPTEDVDGTDAQPDTTTQTDPESDTDLDLPPTTPGETPEGCGSCTVTNQSQKTRNQLVLLFGSLALLAGAGMRRR